VEYHIGLKSGVPLGPSKQEGVHGAVLTPKAGLSRSRVCHTGREQTPPGGVRVMFVSMRPNRMSHRLFIERCSVSHLFQLNQLKGLSGFSNCTLPGSTPCGTFLPKKSYHPTSCPITV
jgi:hypothetical protein